MLTLGRFAQVTGAVPLRAGAPIPDLAFVPSSDSRTIAAGETFVCLRGPNFDGHDHVDDAVRRGAIAIVGDDRDKLARAQDVAVLVVDDAKRAYLRGAAEARSDVDCTVIGITGSVGKTTTTAMCAQILESKRRVAATPRNENNELGVSKLCYSLDAGVEIAVIEMGARGPGEIAQLVEIARPGIGILTNVGDAHMEYFEEKAELARTKFALFDRGARAVLSAADEWSRTLAAQAGIDKSALWVRLCGDPQCEGLTLEAGAVKDEVVPVTLGASHAFAAWHLAGEHHLRDALLAAGGAILAGLSFEEAIAQFGTLRLPPGRFELHRTRSGAVLVYDGYNASPTSMEHALRAFAELPASRHIAVLGSMAELGSSAESLHAATGAAAARARVDALFCGGDFAQAIASGAVRAGMPESAVSTYASNAEIVDVLRSILRSGDAVLLKGSRVQKMEEILAGLSGTEAMAR
jgi:UDP-N-acetylmuramoyl-tripeptide--D-alanyl-D-alanine ligase